MPPQPEKLDLVLKLVQTTSTLAIGVAAWFLAYRQYKISRTKLKFDLYEKRLALYKSLTDFLYRAGWGQAGPENLHKRIPPNLFEFRHDTVEYKFLFDDPEIHDCFEQVYDTAGTLRRLLLMLPEGPITDETLKEIIEHRAQLMLWGSKVDKLFKEELSIKLLR